MLTILLPSYHFTMCVGDMYTLGAPGNAVSRSGLPRASVVGLTKFREFADCNVTEFHSPNEAGFVVYNTELENVAQFGGFREWLHSFELMRGKKKWRRRLNREKVLAIFKGCFRVYKTPLPKLSADYLLPVNPEQDCLFGGIPKNQRTKVLVRCYAIKAMNLKPTDKTNTTDPYIVLQLGSQRLSDKENYISKQLNPVFGKCFEFVANFPSDTTLRVQVFDWNLVGSDDLIGETVIDLENRFYSRHRPCCGLARIYEIEGPNAWRDALKPSQIFKKLCADNQLDGPYFGTMNVSIGNIVYEFQEQFKDREFAKENMSLCLLHRWGEICPGKYSLTPEHVETRTLHNPYKPGEPQGQLLMWLDMFEEETAPPSLPRDISIRKPESLELRVIIWNTDEVILEDDAFFTGEKMSDIYVKGWLTGTEDAQKTDVHYRSLTGEGNFNWRFVFPFDYLRVERQIVVKRKMSLFSWDETEFKVPPTLHLQVWDADHFSADDCLGNLDLDLNRFPRGAKTAQLCTLDMLRKDGTVPHISLFKQHRVKGWWPFTDRKSTGEIQLTGKLEAEIHLLTEEEAEKSPAGVARQEPDALSKPKRPETSFKNWLNPMKTLRYAVWKNYKRRIIKILLILALAAFFVLFCYSAPGYTVKRLLGA